MLVQAALAKKPGRNHIIPGCKEASTLRKDIRANVTDSAVSSELPADIGAVLLVYALAQEPYPRSQPWAAVLLLYRLL